MRHIGSLYSQATVFYITYSLSYSYSFIMNVSCMKYSCMFLHLNLLNSNSFSRYSLLRSKRYAYDIRHKIPAYNGSLGFLYIFL
jgi:hypothetical protein